MVTIVCFLFSHKMLCFSLLTFTMCQKSEQKKFRKKKNPLLFPAIEEVGGLSVRKWAGPHAKASSTLHWLSKHDNLFTGCSNKSAQHNYPYTSKLSVKRKRNHYHLVPCVAILSKKVFFQWKVRQKTVETGCTTGWLRRADGSVCAAVTPVGCYSARQRCTCPLSTATEVFSACCAS